MERERACGDQGKSQDSLSSHHLVGCVKQTQLIRFASKYLLLSRLSAPTAILVTLNKKPTTAGES